MQEVYASYTYDGTLYPGGAAIIQDYYPEDQTRTDAGVALVRVSSVPLPAAAWLFGSGLLGLIGVAKRKKV